MQIKLDIELQFCLYSLTIWNILLKGKIKQGNESYEKERKMRFLYICKSSGQLTL